MFQGNYPAFPQFLTFNANGEPVSAGMYFEGSGMSTRQWLAGQALAGVSHMEGSSESIAGECVRRADALLAALDAQGKVSRELILEGHLRDLLAAMEELPPGMTSPEAHKLHAAWRAANLFLNPKWEQGSWTP